MKVEIINKDEVKDLFKHWGNFSSVCYDSQSEDYSAIGKKCLDSGHFSGSRTRYIEFKITDIARKTIDQLVRHEVGVVKNVQSFRYVKKDNFKFEYPKDVKDEEIKDEYYSLMESCSEMYETIYDHLKENGYTHERAAEQARYVLPMSTLSSCTIGFTLEAFIHFCNERLCSRAEDDHRQLAFLMRNEVIDLIPEVKDYCVPKCQRLLYCPEYKSCGAYPSKKQLLKVLEK